MTIRTSHCHSLLQILRRLHWRYSESGLVVEQSEWFEDEQESRCLSTTQYSYNARQQLKATNPDSVVEFEYDDQGRLCSERINGQEIVHQWNDTDNTLALTVLLNGSCIMLLGHWGVNFTASQSACTTSI